MTVPTNIADSTPIEHTGDLLNTVDSLLAIPRDADRSATNDVPPTMSSSMSTPGTQPVIDAHPHRRPDVASPNKPAGTPSQEPSPPAPAAAAPAEKPAPGLLSVYFLGGVGELWVDGTLFARQPPFDRASIAAGTHHLTCKMSGDEIARKLTITVRSGELTTVEYEVGGTPVVVDR